MLAVSKQRECFAVAFPQTLWISFGVVWDIAVFDLVSSGTEEAMYLTLDFCAKVRLGNSDDPVSWCCLVRCWIFVVFCQFDDGAGWPSMLG